MTEKLLFSGYSIRIEIRDLNYHLKRIHTYLEAFVDEPLVKKLTEHPPNAFHEIGIERFVPIVKVDPTTQPVDSLLPLL